jgi:hypothetical protein
MNPTQAMQNSTAAIQSEDSMLLPDIRIQQYSFEMCTAKLYGHPNDTVLSIDTRTNKNNGKYGN